MLNGCEIGIKFENGMFTPTYKIIEFPDCIVIKDNTGDELVISKFENVYNTSKLIMLWVYQKEQKK